MLKSGKKVPLEHGKPVGESGGLRAGFGFAQYTKNQYPHKKDEIEKLVVERLFSQMDVRRFYDTEAVPTQNKENDIDFTLITRQGEEFLELAEVLLPKNGSPYANAPSFYNHEDMVSAVIKCIMKKSDSYVVSGRLHLLLYSTHYSFQLTQEVVDAIASRLRTYNHFFTSIAYTSVLVDRSICLTYIFPYRFEKAPENIVQDLQGKYVVFGKLANSKIEPDGSVTIPIDNPLDHLT